MTNVLLVPMAGGVGLGPLSQLWGIAEQLNQSGWQSHWAVSPAHHRVLARRRIASHELRAPVPRHQAFTDFRLSDVLHCSGVAEDGFLRREVTELRRIIRKRRIDVVVSALSISAPLAAKAEGVPIASIAAGADLPEFSSPLYLESPYRDLARDAVAPVLYDLGLEPIEDVGELSFLRSDLAIAPTWKRLDPLLDRHDVEFVGPIRSRAIDGDSRRPPPDRPFVLVYLNRGSVSGLDTASVLAQVADEFPESQIVVVGPPVTDAPARVSFQDHAPIGRWLPSAQVLVSGGGYNAMLAAVEYAIPVIAYPGMSAERHYYASVMASLDLARITTVESGLEGSAAWMANRKPSFRRPGGVEGAARAASAIESRLANVGR